jgi:hypothetical protein
MELITAVKVFFTDFFNTFVMHEYNSKDIIFYFAIILVFIHMIILIRECFKHTKTQIRIFSNVMISGYRCIMKCQKQPITTRIILILKSCFNIIIVLLDKILENVTNT